MILGYGMARNLMFIGMRKKFIVCSKNIFEMFIRGALNIILSIIMYNNILRNF